MPQCSAIGCSTQAIKGNRLFRLPSGPQNEERRIIWINKIGRRDWIPTKDSRLCSAHFTPDQYEQNRADGVIKLKPNAIPTLFSHKRIPAPRKPPGKRVKANSSLCDQNTSESLEELIKQEIVIPDCPAGKHCYNQDLKNQIEELVKKLNLARENEAKWKAKYDDLSRRINNLFSQDQVGKNIKYSQEDEEVPVEVPLTVVKIEPIYPEEYEQVKDQEELYSTEDRDPLEPEVVGECKVEADVKKYQKEDVHPASPPSEFWTGNIPDYRNRPSSSKGNVNL